MKQFLSTIWQFIKGDRQALLASRFIWELVAVAIGIALTWLISQLTGQQSLQACQDERAILLQEKTSAQSFADSVRWSAVLTEKNTTIKHLQNELLYFQEKNALDSAAAMSELETMRSINQRYKDQAKRR